jgi:hypothetical protein
MDGEAKRHRVVRHLLGAIVRDITDADALLSATREIDNIIPDAKPDDHSAFLQLVDKIRTGGNNSCQNCVCIFRFTDCVPGIIHGAGDQLDISALEELVFERKIGVRRA